MALDDAPITVAGCVFCTPYEMEHILAETPHFRVVADHAPLVEGHMLIIPRAHYACYGAVPEALEDELIAIKRRVARFLRTRYRAPAFFEHGVFRQTVFHAHLHALPFGPLNLPIFELAHPEGRPVHRLADLRAWYAERGHYFYLEQARLADQPLEAAVFPAEEERYFKALRTIREQADDVSGWQPALLRRAQSGPQIRALVESWQASEREGDTQPSTS